MPYTPDDPETTLQELEAELTDVCARLGRARAAVTRREALRRVQIEPDFVDLRRYAKVAAQAALKHVEHERNMVLAQVEAAIHSALLRDYACKAHVCAHAAQGAEPRDRRPAGERLDDLQRQIRQLRAVAVEHRAGNRVIARRQINPV